MQAIPNDSIDDEQDENVIVLPTKKSKEKVLPLRAQKNILFKVMFYISTNNYFNISITGCIILNTILLAMDKYPIAHAESHF